MKKLYRSKEARKIAGVCGGLGEFFGIDPTFIRIFFVLGTLCSGVFPSLGAFLVIYIVLWLVVPEKKDGLA